MAQKPFPLRLLLISSLVLLFVALNVVYGNSSESHALYLLGISLTLVYLSIFMKTNANSRKLRQTQVLIRKSAPLNRSAETFILNLLSDLRRPMQGLLGVNDLYSSVDSKLETNDFFEISTHCTKLLIKKIERIQLFIELENTTFKINPILFSPKACIDNIIKSSKNYLPKPIINVVVEYSPEIPEYVLGCEFAFANVISELIMNALLFASVGDVKVGVFIDPTNANQINVSIEDSGPGLSESAIQIINSNNTEQAHQQKWPDIKSGLGIIIVKRIICKINSHISVNSTAGQGTRYIISFNEICLSISQNDMIKSSARLTTTLRVLVVDDEPIARHVLCLLLKQLGITADVASDGLDALAKFNLTPHDLIFMDLAMPLMNGFDAARIIISRIGNNARTDIIALSALCTQSEIRSCEEIGFADVLARPAGIEKIRDSLLRLGYYFENKMPNDATSIGTAIRNNFNNSNPISDYYLNFDQLSDSLNNDLPFCFELLEHLGNHLDGDLIKLEKSLSNNNQIETLATLHKLHGKFSLTTCLPAMNAIKKMSSAVLNHNLAEARYTLNEIGYISRQLQVEIRTLIENSEKK